MASKKYINRNGCCTDYAVHKKTDVDFDALHKIIDFVIERQG